MLFRSHPFLILNFFLLFLRVHYCRLCLLCIHLGRFIEYYGLTLVLISNIRLCFRPTLSLLFGWTSFPTHYSRVVFAVAHTCFTSPGTKFSIIVIFFCVKLLLNELVHDILRIFLLPSLPFAPTSGLIFRIGIARFG